MTTKDNWIKAFDEFLLTLDIRLLFSDRNKLEAFISQVEKDAIERTRKECEDLHKNDSTPEEIRELMENVEKQAIEKTNKRCIEILYTKLCSNPAPHFPGSLPCCSGLSISPENLSDLLEDK